jgi:hypothetical protein
VANTGGGRKLQRTDASVAGGKILFLKVQYFQTSLLNLSTLRWEIFYWWMIDSGLCDLKFFGDGALFCSLEE